MAFGQVAPGRTGSQHPEMPFGTRQLSTRGTPLGLLGSSGSITRHSKSVRSYRLMWSLNQNSACVGSQVWCADITYVPMLCCTTRTRAANIRASSSSG